MYTYSYDVYTRMHRMGYSKSTMWYSACLNIWGNSCGGNRMMGFCHDLSLKFAGLIIKKI